MIKAISPRLYQETIFSSCVGKNCLVVLPTGLGKTIVALMLAAQRLKNFPNSKVVFLAPTKPLVEQHLRTFVQYLDLKEEELVLFTGHVKPEKRGILWNNSRVIFSTPQGMENDLMSGRISLEKVSLLIFDEAHRATGDYAYSFIAKQYDKYARYPRILALTASPGSDLEHINEVCENLYIEDVELRTDDAPDVKPYVQDVDLQWIKVDFPQEFKRVKEFLDDSFKSKLLEIKQNGFIESIDVIGKMQLLRMQAHLRSELSSGDHSFEVLKSISLVAEAMKVQHAIELLETQGITPLYAYFQRIYDDSKTSKIKAVKNLANDINFKSAFILTRNLFESHTEHPKIGKLKEMVANEVGIDRAVKIIIFTQYRDSGKKIEEELNSIEDVSAKLFVGQMKKRGTGITQKQQKEILDEFRRGEFNCLVATSVAEEGLDIPKVDLVMFYEPIPSGIRTIQRRGRTGRQGKGRVSILMTKGTRDEGYRWSAHHKEARMYRELKNLKNSFRLVEKKYEGLKKFIAPELNLSIIVDFREKGSPVIKKLIDMGVRVKIESLEAADYIVSSRTGIEFKTVADFVDSIIDGRLLNQLKKLKRSFERPIIIIEGEEDIYSQRNIHPNAIRGMIATITVSYGIPLIYTKNSKETAALLGVISKRENDSSFHDFNAHPSKKLMKLKELQEYVVSSLPGVGGGLAKPLLAKFGSVRGVINSSVEDMKKIDKIGDKKAKEIQRVLDENYCV